LHIRLPWHGPTSASFFGLSQWFENDTSADPKTMDIKGVEGPNKGKTCLAIYELKDDKLTICYDLSGESRPTEFKTQPKTQLFLVTYEREKPAKDTEK
jgi:hypothetical protein